MHFNIKKSFYSNVNDYLFLIIFLCNVSCIIINFVNFVNSLN